jgi:hypothetical protein
MSRFLITCKLGFGLSALSLLAFSGNPTANGQGPLQNDGSELSHPPQMSATYQTREPRICKPLATAPTPGQAAALIQCTMDVDRPTGLFLMQEVKVAMAAPRSYQADTDSDLVEIDMSAPIYPLSGSLTVFWCSPITAMTPAGKGCVVSPTPVAVGKCWKTTFGDWKCNLAGPAPFTRSGLPGPTDY